MRSHNIVGCEAVLTRGWEAREQAFSPAHGSIRMLPRNGLRGRPMLIFVAGALATVAAIAVAAFLATPR